MTVRAPETSLHLDRLEIKRLAWALALSVALHLLGWGAYSTGKRFHVWEIRYDLRAEVPGEFHALPVVGQAMYVPEIRANGSELRIRVNDAK